MKKFLTVFAALTLSAAVLTGCGGKTADKKAADSKPADTSAAEKQEDAAPELSSSVLVIDGKEYTFPVAVSDLLADGWTIDEDKLAEEFEAGELSAEGGSTAVRKSDSDKFFIRAVYNPDAESAKPLSECMIMGVQFTFSVAKDTTVVFPGGATEKSTYDEILEVYGDPENTKDFAGGRKDEKSLAYDKQAGSGNSFNFGFEKDGAPSSFIFMHAE